MSTFEIFIAYSVVFYIRNFKKIDIIYFLLIFFFVIQYEYTSFPPELLTNPIVIRIFDIPLLLMSIVIVKNLLFDRLTSIIKCKELLFIVIFILLYLMVGILIYGYPAIAEFRTRFYFIIIIGFLLSKARTDKNVILYIKKTIEYFVPLILLAPLNILFVGDFSISVKNRQLSSYLFETISISIIVFLVYLKMMKPEFKKYNFLIISIWLVIAMIASHRSVWAVIAVEFFILISIDVVPKKVLIPFILIILIIITQFFYSIIPFLSKRIIVFTDFLSDPTGVWRFYVWKAVVEDATIFGKGIGARFILYAENIGFEASAGSHNLYVTFLHYMGYLGVICFIIFLIAALIRFYKHYKISENYKDKFVSLSTLISIIGIIVYAISYELDFVSWIFLSLGYANVINSKLTLNDKEKY